MCVCASLRRLNVKGCPTCTSATWRDQRAPFFVLRISIAVVGPAGRWVPERGGGSDAGGRRAGPGATAGRRPWSTLTCDADRYGDACRDCHVCAVHERKRPSRMREWQWAETVNRTEKGGGLRARLSARRDLSTRRDRADARDRNRIWGYRILSDPYRSYDPGSRARALRRAFSSFTTVRARGVVCGDASYCAVLL